MKDTTIQAILARLMRATSSPSEAALSGPLGVSSQAVYDARKREKIPDSWIRVIAEKFDVSADWLFFGRGPMRLSEDALIASGSPSAQQDMTEFSLAAQESNCAVCAELKRELERERLERRELSGEIRQLTAEIRQATEGARQTATHNHELTSHNHELTSENRNLWKENGDLREKCARFEERQYQRTSRVDSETVGYAE